MSDGDKEPRYRVIIARHRDMGNFVSDVKYTNDESIKLVDQLRKVFDECGINLSAYRKEAT